MSREIRFRVWNKMVIPNRYTDPERINDDAIELFSDFTVLSDNDLRTIEFYTGLKDKNGEEVYEGDIVSIHNKSHKNEYDIGVIEFKKGAFRCPFLLGKYQSGQVEVIGNIHENPELIGGEE